MSDMQMQKRRILWRTRRGTKELDVILATFIENEFEQLSQEELHQFEQLLDVQEPILNEWLYLGIQPPQTELRHIVKRILSSHKPTPRS